MPQIADRAVLRTSQLRGWLGPPAAAAHLLLLLSEPLGRASGHGPAASSGAGTRAANIGATRVVGAAAEASRAVRSG